MEGTYDEEIHERINHLLCERTCVQMEHSQDAVRIKRIRAQKSSLHKQFENQNGFGELCCGACTSSLAEKLDES